jgi:hypothetical protein
MTDTDLFTGEQPALIATRAEFAAFAAAIKNGEYDDLCEQPLHELVFTDRAARPAKWQTRCGRTDVPLERTLTPTATSHYQVTCPACLAAGNGGGDE